MCVIYTINAPTVTFNLFTIRVACYLTTSLTVHNMPNAFRLLDSAFSNSPRCVHSILLVHDRDSANSNSLKYYLTMISQILFFYFFKKIELADDIKRIARAHGDKPGRIDILSQVWKYLIV